MSKYGFLFLLFVSLFWGGQGSANCLTFSTNERLSNYCLAQSITKYGVAPQHAFYIEDRLNREGYSMGIGLPTNIKPLQVGKFLVPLVGYSDNVNGGNPDKPLVVAGLDFSGDPKFVKKSGLLLGLRTGLYARQNLGQGHYIDYQTSLSYEYAPKHALAVKRLDGSVCSKNHLGNLIHADFCITAGKQIKELTNQSNRAIDVSVSKLIGQKDDKYHELSFGLKRVHSGGFTQNQAALGIQSIYGNGLFSSVGVQFGEAVQDELAIKLGGHLSIGYQLFSKPISMRLAYSEYDGLRMIGIARKDVSHTIGLVYSVSKDFDLSAGYEVTDSTINYFDLRSPKFGVHFKALTF